jgi:psiF repeat-containing protein
LSHAVSTLQWFEENTMTKTSIVAGVVLSLAIGFGPALAQQDQQPAAAPSPPPAKSTTKSTMSPEQKAISKACSDQANAKNLHGDERKKFRSECKRKGGKME